MAVRPIAALTLLALSCSVAQAQEQQATVGELSQLNAVNILKESQLTGAQLDAKLRKTGGAQGGGAAAGEVISATSHADTTAAGTTSPPVVKGVFGANGTLYATFLYADGTHVDRKQGATIPGGYVVAHIDGEHVALRRGRQIIDIAFSSAAPMERAAPSPTPGSIGTFGGVLPIPPMPSPAMQNEASEP